MEQKTKLTAEDGKQDLVITREFDLPIDLLFKAYVEADIVEQWMGTKVLKMDAHKHGGYQFQTTREGKVVFRANGAIHELIPERKIIRTFEMENTPFGVQLEVYDFEALTADTSKLTMHVIFESGAQRDQNMQLGLSWGVNMAHDRLQQVVSKLK